MAKKTLRILHTESSCGWGGQEIRILNEMAGFARRGHKVALICPPEAEIYPAALARKITTHALPIARKNANALMSLGSWLKQHAEGFDVINTHSSTDSWLVALTNQWRRKRLPVVRTRHVSTKVNLSWPTRWLYQTATDYIVTTGEAVRQQLHKANGFDLARMRSIPTGVDFTIFYPKSNTEMKAKLNLPAHQFLFGIVATIRSWKGHTYLFDAFHSLQAKWPDARIVVVGDGPYKDRLETHLQHWHLTDKVDFVGRQENVADWLNAFDVFCLPSYGEEGVPQALMQAMACGKAVISTPVGAISEAVKDQQTGLLVEPKNAKQLAQAMLRLYQETALRQQFGEAAVQHIQENFSDAQMLDRMESVFHQVQVSH